MNKPRLHLLATCDDQDNGILALTRFRWNDFEKRPDDYRSVAFALIGITGRTHNTGIRICYFDGAGMDGEDFFGRALLGISLVSGYPVLDLFFVRITLH